jgi:hypothetical protein
VAAVKSMALAPKKSSHLSPEHAVEEIGRLCDHYRLSRNNANAMLALHQAIVERLVKIPRDLKRGRGRPSIWEGDVGLELVNEVERIRSWGRPGLRKPMTTRIIRALQKHKPAKWGQYDETDLCKRYFEARRYWTWPRRIEDFVSKAKPK